MEQPSRGQYVTRLVVNLATTDPTHCGRLRAVAPRGGPVLERAIYNLLRYGAVSDQARRLRRELTVDDMDLVDWDTVARLVADPANTTAPQRGIGPVPLGRGHGADAQRAGGDRGTCGTYRSGR